MSPHAWISCLVCLACLSTVPAPLVAAGLPRAPAPKRPATAPYVPRVQEYTVVVPSDPHQAPHDQILWEQQHPKAPMYPYGWFGARSYSQRGTHVRYYGDTYDFNIRRGY